MRAKGSLSKFKCTKCGIFEMVSGGQSDFKCKPCRIVNGVDPLSSPQYLAHRAVAKSILLGELPRPSTLKCVDCGKNAVHYDHRDYRKPLEVAPVCASCNCLRGAAIDMLESLPVVDSEPAVWMQSTHLSQFVNHGASAGSFMARCSDIQLQPDYKALYTSPQALNSKAIHYPECWDTAAYPTLESALSELYAHFKCSEHPQALTPITVIDVTDEMLDALHTNTHPASTRAEILAAAVNAYLVIKNRGEAK